MPHLLSVACAPQSLALRSYAGEKSSKFWQIFLGLRWQKYSEQRSLMLTLAATIRVARWSLSALPHCLVFCLVSIGRLCDVVVSMVGVWLRRRKMTICMLCSCSYPVFEQLLEVVQNCTSYVQQHFLTKYDTWTLSA
jgi:hypothetical protein